VVAPYDEKDDRTREHEQPPIAYTSYMPEVQRVPAPSARRRQQKRAARRRAPIRVPWKLLTIIALLPFIGLVALLIYNGTRSRLAASPADTESSQPILYITATPNLNLALTATSILPPDYIQSLSQTPGSTFPTPDPLQGSPGATPTFAFVPVGTEPPPFFIPHDSKIVYVSFINGSDEIFLMNGDGTEPRQLTAISGTDYYPSLSINGQTIVFASQRGNRQWDIYAMDIGGGSITQLTNTREADSAPELSPDGTQVVYTSTAAGRGDQDLWVVNIDGTNPRQITFDNSNEIDPSWSPDGTMISFGSNRTGPNELYVMNADGSNIQQVTTGIGIGGRNDWSPDGRWLAFYAGPGSNKEIFVVPIECAFVAGGCDLTLVRQLTYGGQNKAPSFSPDGQWITFTSKRDGDNEIFTMRFDGSEITQLTFNDSPDWMPRWGP
jgi:dipeptidyl aminopeptidase/acylaminoacyl peptidase